jgi:hypothetical protein
LVSAWPPPSRSAASVQEAAETVVASAQHFAAARSQLPPARAAAGAPRPTPHLRCHPALSGPDADPAGQGWQLAEEAARRITRAGRNWLTEDLAPLVEDVFGIDVAVVATPVWFDGAAWSDRTAKIAVVGATDRPGRQRFALAHQVCHLLAEEENSLHVDASIEQVPPERARSETRANAFAEAFLMPGDVLRELTPKRWTAPAFAALALWLDLPARALTRRLHQLGLMPMADRRHFEGLGGADLAALLGASQAYARRCRRAAQPRLPAQLIQDAAQQVRHHQPRMRP